jgi:hypothetical protein
VNADGIQRRVGACARDRLTRAAINPGIDEILDDGGRSPPAPPISRREASIVAGGGRHAGVCA